MKQPCEHPPLQKTIMFALALLVVVMAAYFPSLRAEFVWDDDDYVQENPTLLSFDGLKQIWTEPKSIPQYYPLVHTTFWVEYQLWGLNPTGFHVVNIILHGLAAVMLWRILWRLSVPGAWLAAAVFALHPVNVESVAWIAERKNVLSGLLYMAALLTYLHFNTIGNGGQTNKRWKWYLLSLLFFIGALLSKTVTCSLPIALLLIIWWKHGRITRGEIGRLIPYFAVGLVLGLVTIWLEKVHVGAEGSEWDISFWERCLAAGRIPWFYAGKLLWPVNLMFVYPRWEINPAAVWQYIFPLMLITLISGLFITRRRIGRGWLIGALGFVVTLFPALSFIDVYPMRYSFVADHYQYLATPWFITLVVSSLTWQVRRRSINFVITMKLFGGLLLVTLGVLTWQRCHVFQNLENLWLDTLAKNPDCWMAHNNYGRYLQLNQQLDKALMHYQKSVELNPREPFAHYNLGNALHLLDRQAEALIELNESIRLEPRNPHAFYSRANVLKALGRPQEAIQNYMQALQRDPQLASAHYNLANTFAERKQNDHAIYHYQQTLKIDPDHAKAHYRLAMVLKSPEAINETIAHLQKAVELMPDEPLPANELAWILATHPDPAIRNGREALDLARQAAQVTQYRNPVILDTLAAAYAELGQFEQAVEFVKKALDLPETAQSPQLSRQLAKNLDNYRQGIPTRDSGMTP